MLAVGASAFAAGQLEYLPAGFFDPLTGVTQLTLQHMYRLQELPADVFAPMPLTKLQFKDCAIGSFHPDAFRGLESVTEL